jgi:hypothetical protein
MDIRPALLVLAVCLNSPAVAQDAAVSPYSFTTTGEYVSQCGAASLAADCLSAVQHVEEVVDYDQDFHPINDTCDGGPEAMLNAGSNDQMTAWLTERVERSVAWLKAHPEYDGKSYGDGIWAGLKGAYCS